jgi:hypothetical protein
MKTPLVITLVLVCAAVCAPRCAHAADRGPSTPEERSQMLDEVHAWQANPLGPQAKDHFRTVFKFFADVPDLTVHVCMILDKLPKGSKKDADTIFGGQFMGQAQFVLESPNKNDDRVAEFQAGTEGALHTYQVLVQSNEKDRESYLDDLVKRREHGTLADYVKERSATCTR